MSVTVTSPISAGYVPNGATRAFAFNFKAASTAEIAVYQVLAGVWTLINPSAYAVVLAGGEGGTATFTVAPVAGTGTIYVVSAPWLTQTLALANDGPFTPSILNGALDRAAIRDVFLNFQANRSLKVPLNETDPGYPDAADRANNYLTHDGAGKPVPGISTDGVNQMLSDILTNAGDIADEAAARVAGDNALAASLATETAARVASGNTLSAGVAAEINARTVADNTLAASIAALAIPALGTGINGMVVVTPEQYAGAKASGVVGDGTDDGPALHAASAIINALGGGVLALKPAATYWVGDQTQGGVAPTQAGGGIYTWAPNTGNPIEISGCTKPVVVMGNGATIKCLPGKKYGAFNVDGTARNDTPPYTGAGIAGFALSTPYAAMVWVHGCSGSVSISDLDLDGNIINQVIGGQWGDTGRQIPMVGLSLKDNTGPINVRNVNAHNHGEDGGIGDGLGLIGTREQVVIETSAFTNNGRQGFSLVAGNGWKFIKCKFNQTGKNVGFPIGSPYSSPGAGVDIEAEGGRWVINCSFDDCEFEDNSGCGLVSDTSSKIKNIKFNFSRFIGTTNWCVWPRNPRMRFDDCTLVGAWTHVHVNSDPDQASKFKRCLITNDVAFSPTGVVFGSSTGYTLLDVGGGSQNIRYEDCKIQQTFAIAGINVFGNLPTGIDDVNTMQYHNCVFEKVGTTDLRVDGIFSGERTTFIGCIGFPDPNAVPGGKLAAGYALDSFIFDGTRYKASMDRVNGKALFRGSKVWDPPNLAAGANTTTTVTCTGAAVGDRVVDISLGVDQAGTILTGYVSAANTVTLVLFNPTGGAVDLASSTVNVKAAQL